MIISAVIYILIFIFSTYYLNRERVFIRNENNNNHHDDIHNRRIRRTYDSEDSEEKEPLSENNSVSPNMSNNY